MVAKKAKAKRTTTRNAKSAKPARAPRKPVENAMGLMNLGWGGFPQNQGSPYSEQLSDVTTSFINLRWYFVSNMRQFLSELYCEIGLVQTICDVPVDDALRGGIEIKSKQIDEDQIKQLKNSLDRDDDLNTVGQSAKWNRLFGGAGVLILTDQSPIEPLNMAAIGPDTPLEFRSVDMWELFWDKQNTEGYDPAIQSEDFEYYNYYGEQVHKSRVMRLTGIVAPSFNRPRLRGWGFSCVEALIRSMNQYLKATDLSFEVLDEFKLDIYRIKNLVNTMLSPNATNSTKERIAQLNYFKNYQNAIVLDSEDEYETKQISFTGIAETMQQIRMQVAADMRMPLTKLFGISASGFNSGEDDIEVYNAMVESQVRNKIKYIILRVCEIKCQKLFGMVPDDLTIEFKPLRVMSSEQQENVKTQKFNRAWMAKQGGELTTEEFRDICNKGNLFDINLDTQGLEDGGGYMDDVISEGVNDPQDPKDIDNPGADRMDTEKSRATEVGGIGKEPVDKPAPSSADEPKSVAQVKSIRTASLETQRRRMRSGSRPKRVMANIRNMLASMFPKPKQFLLNAEWKESDHPRADDGKFGEGGASAGGEAPKPGKKRVAGKLPADSNWKMVGSGPYSVDSLTASGGDGKPGTCAHCNKSIKTCVDISGDDGDYTVGADCAEALVTGEAKTKLVDAIKDEKKKQKEVKLKVMRIEEALPFNKELMDQLRQQFKDASVDLEEFNRVLDISVRAVIDHNGKNPDEKKAWTHFVPQALQKISEEKEPKKQNRLFSRKELWERAGTVNSAAFAKASYEADGGDKWIDERRKYFFEVPKDPGLYKRCKDQAGGNWKYAVWLYEKQGGVWW